jgi:TolA-binding protein
MPEGGRVKKRIIAIIAFAAGLAAQSPLDEGLDYFSKGDYSNALARFRAAALSMDASQLGEINYWMTMADIALGSYADAGKRIEDFLVRFPKHPRTSEMIYQKGRILFLQKEYDTALQVFQGFMEAYPQDAFYPAALFWSAESLFGLGQLEYAKAAYERLIEKFPDSVKFEAATYRLGLIAYRVREEELLKVLKWSHEESLRTIEEFQRREKTYEQAVQAYQKRIAEMLKDTRLGDLEKEKESLAAAKAALEASLKEKEAAIRSLESALADKEASLSRLKAENAALAAAGASPSSSATGAPSSASRGGTDSAATAAAPTPSSLDAKAALLALKEEALALEEFYLSWLSRNKAE